MLPKQVLRVQSHRQVKNNFRKGKKKQHNEHKPVRLNWIREDEVKKTCFKRNKPSVGVSLDVASSVSDCHPPNEQLTDCVTVLSNLAPPENRSRPGLVRSVLSGVSALFTVDLRLMWSTNYVFWALLSRGFGKTENKLCWDLAFQVGLLLAVSSFVDKSCNSFVWILYLLSDCQLFLCKISN